MLRALLYSTVRISYRARSYKGKGSEERGQRTGVRGQGSGESYRCQNLGARRNNPIDTEYACQSSMINGEADE
jgi:hypothetical protein